MICLVVGVEPTRRSIVRVRVPDRHSAYQRQGRLAWAVAAFALWCCGRWSASLPWCCWGCCSSLWCCGQGERRRRRRAAVADRLVRHAVGGAVCRVCWAVESAAPSSSASFRGSCRGPRAGLWPPLCPPGPLRRCFASLLRLTGSSRCFVSLLRRAAPSRCFVSLARLAALSRCFASMRCRAASSRCVVSLFAALSRCSVSLLWLGASSRLLAHQPSHAEEGFRRRCCSRCRRRRFRGRVVAVRVGFVLAREGVAAIWLPRAAHGRR